MGAASIKTRQTANGDSHDVETRRRRPGQSGPVRGQGFGLNATSSRRLQVPPVIKRAGVNKALLIIPMCLASGLILGILTFGNIKVPVPPPPVDPMKELVFVDVPSRVIFSGERLKRTDFTQISLERGQLRDGSAVSIEMVAGKYARTELESKKPIFLGDLSNKPTFKTFQAQIPVGYRGITIAVDATGGIEGWSRAGAHVDLIVSYVDKRDGKKKTQTAVENATVLSFKGMTSQMMEEEGGGRPVNVSYAENATVTLAVPVKDALRIQTAKMLGQISLFLRNPKDVSPTKKKIATPEDLRRMTAPMTPPVVSTPTFVPPPVIQKANPTPDGFARFKDLKSGEIMELELYGLEWKKSSDSEY